MLADVWGVGGGVGGEVVGRAKGERRPRADTPPPPPPLLQLNGREWGWAALNRLCWAIGSISGSMVEEQENR